MNYRSISIRGRRPGSFIIKHLPVIVAFLIPVFILLILYIGRGVFPFGSNTYLRSDMYHQYAPFMKEFQRNIQQGGSFIYSWNIGLGNNFASTYAYYLASPANWLVGLFPDTLVPEFMNLMLILKSGLMSAVFAWYLIRKYRKNNYIATASGCFYAMSSYMAAFSWNIMWLDCLVLLPLIMMGLEHMVKSGKYKMYVITLAVCVITNYYIAIMISIFLVFYFIYLLIVEMKSGDAVSAVHRILLFAASSIIAGAMAMFIVLPALFNLFITASASSSFPSNLTAYYNLLELFSKAVINTEPAVFNGHLPNIYSTMALFLTIPLYWLSKRVPAKEKAAKTALIALMIFSFMFNVPTYVWHGFHFPNSLPCRYSFIFILLVLEMGYQALINIRRFSIKEISICCGISVLAVFLLQSLYGTDSFNSGNAASGAAFILLYYIAALLLRNRNASRILTMILLLIVSVAEIVINTNNTGYSTTNRTAYMEDNAAIADLLSQVDDDGFYRVEKVTRKTKNDGTWNNYNSASVFSSTTVSGNTEMYKDLGMQGKTNSYSFYGHTPVSQAMLGVKYEIAREEQHDPLMSEAASYNDQYYLYENKYAFSLGYMLDESVLQMDMPVSEPFEFQNEFVRNACGVSDVFITGNSIMGEQAVFETEHTGRLLIYITSELDKCRVEISRDGEITFRKDYSSIETPQIIDALGVKKGDLVTVTTDDPDASSLTVHPAVMIYNRYSEAMRRISERQMKITYMKDSHIAGSVDAGPGQILFTTIPYDPGWTVYVDGAEYQYSGFNDSFIVLDLEPGFHELEFIYWPKGLTAGIIVSIAALVLFIVLGFIVPDIYKNRKPGRMHKIPEK